MGALFDVKQATISEHINNILEVNELDETSIGISDRSTGGRKPRVYNLDMILSVGYRVNSKRGIEFRRWANSVLKQYIIRGYATNESRLQQLGDVVRLMKRTQDSLDSRQVLSVIESYSTALDLLDDYDHQTMKRPKGSDAAYVLSQNENMAWYEPQQGTNKWVDAMVIPANASCPGLANAFINYMASYDVQTANASEVGYTSPRTDVAEEMTAPGGDYEGISAANPRSDGPKDEVFHYNQKLTAKLSDLWNKVKVQ